MSQNYLCVNCNCSYSAQVDYKNHYKSEHHRYNVKRKLINLLPLTLQEYLAQFDNQLSSKSSVQKELHCEICSKKFMSANTYKQHLNSQKHQSNRKKITSNKPLSKSSSSSSFQVLGLQKVKKCLFCSHSETSQHLKAVHSFPPFPENCINPQGLYGFVEQKIKNGQCLYCERIFQSIQSVKQHMQDLGHCKLNVDHFTKYERYYLWKIQESSDESEAQHLIQQNNEDFQDIQQESQDSFVGLGNPTLSQLQRKRMKRIKFTPLGPIINGKQVGFRYLKRYYKQYLGRVIPINPYRANHCLENGQNNGMQLTKIQKPMLYNSLKGNGLRSNKNCR